MMKKIKINWCNWPHRENKRDPGDLNKVGARCDAWRSFLQSETVAKLKKMKGNCIWFNKYEYFDKLICEFDCSEKRLRSVIKSLMRKGHGIPIEFIRDDIYDARAWVKLPLCYFIEIDVLEYKERSGKDIWQSDILKHNEMPIIYFGIKLPWVVDSSCFTLTHRLKNGERYAEMIFRHPQLDRRFDGKRWAADDTFPRETTRKEMTEYLFAKVKNECAKHLVNII